MPDIIQLNKATDEFFQKYWSIEKNGQHPYKWENNAWEFTGSIPNNDKKGCYALVKGDEVRYIGVGIGNSSERYVGSELGDRLKRYWQVNKDNDSHNEYKARSVWEGEEFTGIITIAFDEEHFPIAAALEVYLIRELGPTLLNKSFNNKKTK